MIPTHFEKHMQSLNQYIIPSAVYKFYLCYFCLYINYDHPFIRLIVPSYIKCGDCIILSSVSILQLEPQYNIYDAQYLQIIIPDQR